MPLKRVDLERLEGYYRTADYPEFWEDLWALCRQNSMKGRDWGISYELNSWCVAGRIIMRYGENNNPEKAIVEYVRYLKNNGKIKTQVTSE